ncbi:MAG TPA: DUF692 domain-containing protein [Thermoanaerobaculia bacterium]|nr:DUF692 domain-containing protein [Thermoanaerobaculia bacterium]
MTVDELPFLGVGLAYRFEIREEILANSDRFDFLELITDHYIDMPPHRQEEARELAGLFPLVIHGVDLSIGTHRGVQREYLAKVRQVREWSSALWASDHLCMTQAHGRNISQLTPISFDPRTVEAVRRNVETVREVVDCPFLLENISYYFQVPPCSMTEAEFLREVFTRCDCWLLLDLTNVYNNARNNGYDAFDFLDHIPLDRVVQLHLAGGEEEGGILLDTHSRPIHPEVFELLRYSAGRMPRLKGAIIERDQAIPPTPELLDEMDRIREILAAEWAPPHRSATTSQLSWL